MTFSMPMTAIADFQKLGEKDPYFAALADICSRNNDLWCSEAERYVLTHAPRLEQDSVSEGL